MNDGWMNLKKLLNAQNNFGTCKNKWFVVPIEIMTRRPLSIRKTIIKKIYIVELHSCTDTHTKLTMPNWYTSLHYDAKREEFG